MKLRALAATIVFAAAAPAAMACTSTRSLGDLGPPGIGELGGSFTQAGSYTDCYTFSLDGWADSIGGVLEKNYLFNELEVDVTDVSLYFNGSLIGKDTQPLLFSFGGLAGGSTYTLAVSSTVSQEFGLYTAPVGYKGVIATIASAAPEPETYAMVLAGCCIIGAAVRRKKQA
jgi:hypothetical protein